MKYIYGLREPKQQVYRYIGVTSNPFSRMSNHLMLRPETHAPRLAWLRDCQERHIVPVMDILVLVEDNIALSLEYDLTVSMREAGHPLINPTDGAVRGGRLSEEAKKRLSEANTGKRHSDATKQKMRESARRRIARDGYAVKATEQTNTKRSVALKARWSDGTMTGKRKAAK